ncbi:MAG: chromate transporter [Lentisphaeria bacterium]|nr:chromate transporter [Lentisphaeria bacterium]
MSLSALYFLFLKYGFLCFGGGYVLIPLMIDDFINQRGLISQEAFGNLISIAQLTPGPVGINAATFIGFTQHGVAGAVLASLGVITTSMILASGASYYVTKWKDSFPVKALLTGIRPAALALVFYAVVLFLGMSVLTPEVPLVQTVKFLCTGKNLFPADLHFSFPGLLICIVTILLLKKTKISTTWLILGSAVAGALICR